MTWHLDDYRCTLLRGILRRSFQETSPRNTAENTAKDRGGGESLVTVTTLTIRLFTTSYSMVYFQLFNGTYGVVAHDVHYFIIIVCKQ